MKFIGNKNRLLSFIDEVVKDTGIRKGTFVDLFAGTANVGIYFKKKGFRVISNDTLYFSYIFQMAYINNNTPPKFTKLKINNRPANLQKVIDYLNNLPEKSGFIYRNYAPSGNTIGRQYFSDSNAKKIDAIRSKIQEWYESKQINRNEYFILLAILIDRADFIANNSGTYGAYLKIWRSMALKKLELKKLEIIPSKENNLVYNEDALKLIKRIKGIYCI
jgi:adenine-specific DNA-methyltransferase